MKKIYNYLMLKMSSYKIFYIFILILIYQFTLFFEFIIEQSQYNIYDILINQYDYLPLFISISLGYLLITYNLFDNSKFYQYIHLKYKDRLELFNINVWITFIMAFLLTLFLNIAVIIEGFGKISFENIWSKNFYNKMQGNVNLFYDRNIVNLITKTLSPLKYFLCINIFIILYLFVLGMLFLTINTYLNKRSLTFLIIIMINVLSMVLDSINITENLSFTNNIYILTANSNNINNNLFIIYRIGYWTILIISIYLLGRFLILKMDCKYGN